MRQVKITKFQLYCMIVLYGIGTASLMGVAKDAKQDAWIAVLVGGVLGVLLFLIYGFIYSRYPDITFTKVLDKLFGNLLGKALTLLYSGYFMYIAARNLRDLIELISLFILQGTPPYVINFLTIIIVVYAVYLGLEVIARTSELNFFVTLFVIFVLFTLIGFSGIVDFQNLFPILEKGYKPIVKSSIALIAFPFGELITFMMIMNHVNKKKGVIKVGVLAVVTFTLLLTMMTIINITTIGVYIIENTVFSSIETIKLINVADFIQRVEAGAVLIFMVGTYTKIVLFHYAATTALSEVFQNQKITITHIKLAVSTILFFGAMWIGKNVTTHIHIGMKLTLYSVNIPFEVIIPILVFLFIILKYGFSGNKLKSSIYK